MQSVVRLRHWWVWRHYRPCLCFTQLFNSRGTATTSRRAGLPKTDFSFLRNKKTLLSNGLKFFLYNLFWSTSCKITDRSVAFRSPIYKSIAPKRVIVRANEAITPLVYRTMQEAGSYAIPTSSAISLRKPLLCWEQEQRVCSFFRVLWILSLGGHCIPMSQETVLY